MDMAFLNQQPQNKMAPLYSNMAHYYTAWRSYTGISDPRWTVEVVNWMNTEFEFKVSDKLLANFKELSSPEKGQPFRVLGVGSGQGKIEIDQLKRLAAKFPNLQVCVVEPGEDEIIGYQRNIKQESDLDGVPFEWHNKTLEEFVKTSDQKYHFISAMHVIYFLGNLENAIQSLVNILVPGGVLFLVVLTDHTGEGNVPLFDENSTMRRNYYVTSSDVKGALDQLHISDYTKHEYSSKMNISKFMTGEETREGQLLQDFITCTVDFKNSCPESTRDRMMKYFGNHSEVVQSANGKKEYYFEVVDAIFLISK